MEWLARGLLCVTVMDAYAEANRSNHYLAPPPVRDAAVRCPTPDEALALILWADGATLDEIASELHAKLSSAARLVRAGMESLRVTTQAELIVALGGPCEPAALPAGLTAAERTIVDMLLEGRSNRAIALRRGTSVRTVANQLQAIYDKLGVRSRREVVARVLGVKLRPSVPPLRHAPRE